MMMPVILTNLRFWDPETGDRPPSDVLLRGGLVEGIVPTASAGRPDAVEVLDCAALFAVPGFVNGHHHSHEFHFRGRSECQCLEEWMTGVRPIEPLSLTAEDVRLQCLALAVEALASGTTTICDDVGIDPLARPDLLDAAASAWEEAGIRAWIGPTMFDVPFARAVPFAETILSGVVETSGPDTPVVDRVAALADFARGLARRGGLVRAIVTPSAPQRCSHALLLELGKLAAAEGLPLMTHVLETRVQAVGAALKWPGGIIAHMGTLGLLRPGTALIHGVWLTPAEMEVIATSGTSVQVNPASNLKLGSGVADVAALQSAGVNVSLGSDGCGSVETVGMAATVALAALLTTLRGPPERWGGARAALRAATTGGARALGQEGKLGRIAPGAAADLALYRLDRAPFLPLNDPVRQLVYGMARPAHVFVAGREVMRDSRSLLVDETALSKGVSLSHARLESGVIAAGRAAEAMRPAMRAIWARCQDWPLGHDYDALRLDIMG